jgi:lipoate---protein ligase
MILRHHLHKAARTTHSPIVARRWLSQSQLDCRLSEPIQSYASASRDAYLNLSIEHYLLEKSSPDSVIFFTYVNRPSIIIGRNQNPWLEVNLALLGPKQDGAHYQGAPAIGDVDLVRRRSGGGTVWHDEGNVNWTVICPSAIFTRDKHAEMVVRALRNCGVDRARVNERHDIVLDQGERIGDVDSHDTHVTPYTDLSAQAKRPLKVSGSAYKLTRGRALHHGTCLLSSPNLAAISQYLRSPAKPHMKARGVESVSSPVTNIGLQNDGFIAAVHEQFKALYTPHGEVATETVEESLLEVDAIRKGYDELQTDAWKWLQTPQFSISNSSDGSGAIDISLSVRHGLINEVTITSRRSGEPAPAASEALTGKDLSAIRSWSAELSPQLMGFEKEEQQYVVDWLQKMLPLRRHSAMEDS